MRSFILSAMLSLGLAGTAAFGTSAAGNMPVSSGQSVLDSASETGLPFILAQGILRTGVIAIGGETTGYKLDLYDQSQSYELILSEDLKGKIQHLDGMSIEAEGFLTFLTGPERGPRPAIVVNELRILE